MTTFDFDREGADSQRTRDRPRQPLDIFADLSEAGERGGIRNLWVQRRARREVADQRGFASDDTQAFFDVHPGILAQMDRIFQHLTVPVSVRSHTYISLSRRERGTAREVGSLLRSGGARQKNFHSRRKSESSCDAGYRLVSADSCRRRNALALLSLSMVRARPSMISETASSQGFSRARNLN